MAPKEDKQAKKEAKRLEMLRLEEERLKKLKKEELERELAAHALRRKELDESWRATMLKIKEPVFKRDMEVMWQTFERALDKRNHQIRYIIKLMDIAENQFGFTISNFCDVIDTMINNFSADLEKMSKENDIRTEKCLKDGEEELNKIRTDYSEADEHLQLLLYEGYTKADALAWTTRGIFLVKEDEDRNKYINERDNLRSYLEKSYSNTWDEYKAVLKSYIKNTAENLKEVRKLKKKEKVMSDIIESQGKKIKESDGVLKRLRSELAAYESGTKQAIFRERRNRFRDACHRLKKRLVDDCDLDVKHMALLVSESNSAVEWLETGFKKVDKILRLAALCRKFESQREKVLPFQYSNPQLREDYLSYNQSDDDALLSNILSSSSGLSRLWQRISNAELTKRALLQEKKLLERENMMILQRIQDYDDSNINEAKKCICVTQSGNGINCASPDKPLAIEAVQELHKYV